MGYGWDLTSGDVDTWGPRGGGARIEWMYICREAGYGGGKSATVFHLLLGGSVFRIGLSNHFQTRY